ncbi:carboxylesterase/lipase family protein [Tepidiforma sp.]|uniref:carboxylesterase/lipase family protein n=1 Tax=Tepidiforma sp. TaxID=2682230 RepID=UPI0026395753|nr:carboxylesterase/lipase family protein [Tepidiforma sp.]MCX7616991.1 carboxylesterase/lipase family protein [Tepidiforma sp.]
MPIVETSFGRLEGVSRAGHAAFLGVPYAAAPVGPLRWKAPLPPVAWPGTRPASKPGPAARQTGHPIPGFAASGPQSEDCLSLNIFTPACDSRRRPVLFWIHGGGFTHGSGSEALYDGGPLARRGDVVVVTINYRLGAFGYLHPATRLPGRGLANNCGQLDAIAALRWVHDHIAAFGGDPRNVTIFGESAGAASVGTLLAMPAARGLFHKAILQSGTGRAARPEEAGQVVDRVTEAAGLPSAEGLLTLDADRLLEAQAKVAATRGFGTMLFAPMADGETLPQQPLEAVAAGAAAGIPVMIGTNRDEAKLFFAMQQREPMDDAALERAAGALFPGASGERLRAAIAAVREARRSRGLPAENLDVLDTLWSEGIFRQNALRLALAQRQHEPRTYVYFFTYASPARRGALGACHALEMPFVFGTLDAPGQDRFAGTGPDVERLSANMMDAWIAFARSGDPSHEGIGRWEAYDAERRPTMVFDRESGLERDPYAEERRAAESLLGG